MFIWEKGSLNDEQEVAILEKDSVLLIACPGSGKTRTLTYKIAYELSRLNSNKEFVIAITYTNNAADEIKERVELALMKFVLQHLNGFRLQVLQGS